MSGLEASWEDATTNHKLFGLVWDRCRALKAQEAEGVPIISATASGTLQPHLLLSGMILPNSIFTRRKGFACCIRHGGT